MVASTVRFRWLCHNRDVRFPLSLPNPRRGLACVTGNAAAFVSRKTGRGTGASIRGAIINRIDPGLFDYWLAGKRIAVVSGTNGKTTTTHLLTAAMRESVGTSQVVTNPDGANLREGIVSALSTNPKAPIAVLEVDEQVVPAVLNAGHPEVLVMLNFSRDQLDRHHEINSLGKKWRTILEEMGEDAPVVVANCVDPLVVWAAQAAPRVIWVDLGTGWTQDAALCPQCGAVLVRDHEIDWHCPECTLSRQNPDLWVSDGHVHTPTGSYPLNLKVPGRFNQGNAACALAAAKMMGLDYLTALRGMRNVEAPAGRFATGTFGSTKARLVLAKNPAGWVESLRVMESDPVILAIDSAIADGTDVSWLWDVDYEQLAGRRVIVTGPRSADLAIRLSYAEVEHEVVEDMAAALKGPFDGTVDVLATYSAFLRLCRMGGIDLS